MEMQFHPEIYRDDYNANLHRKNGQFGMWEEKGPREGGGGEFPLREVFSLKLSQ